MIRSFVFFLTLLFGSSLYATTLAYQSLDDLIAKSDGIIHGTVKQIQTDTDSDGQIFTYVLLADIEPINGIVGGDELQLRFEGGSTEFETQFIVGSPEFQIGDDVVMFVRNNGKAMIPLVGWAQGLYRVKENVITDSIGNRLLDIRGADIIKEQKLQGRAEIVGKPVLPPSADQPGMPVEKFLSALKQRAKNKTNKHLTSAYMNDEMPMGETKDLKPRKSPNNKATKAIESLKQPLLPEELMKIIPRSVD